VRDEQRGRGYFARAAAGVFALVAVAGGIAAIALALGLGDRDPLEIRVARVTGFASRAAAPDADPLAFDPARRQEFEQRAATGLSHVIYEKSPGGVVASAKRTAAFRDQIEAAAKRHGVDPALLEAVIFLESAGRPDVIAGPTPESAAGLAQIIPSTATDLLGMSVDLPRSIALTEQISHSQSPQQTDRLQVERAQVDQRFDPTAAIEGAATYLEIAEQRFGDPELAVVSYHMGIGNLETVLRTYAGADDSEPIGDLVAAHGLNYAKVYFDSGPNSHRDAWEMLRGFGDESADYLWKVLASKQALAAYRDDPDQLAATAVLATNKSSLEEVYHPENETRVFESPDDISSAVDDGYLLPLPNDPGLGWEPDPDIGELAAQLDQSPELYRALRPAALATLTYMAGLVRNISGAATPLQVTSAVRDRSYQDLLVQSNIQATQEYSLHTTGWAFDIRRDYESKRQAEAFQFVLDRLRALALIDYAVEPGAIHITVSDLGAELLQG
jgi:soluble lytic murein transglycosylase-like protein